MQLTGILDLHGVQNEVTWEVEAYREGTAISALATLTINFSDYNITVPRFGGLVSISDQATLQVQLIATAANTQSHRPGAVPCQRTWRSAALSTSGDVRAGRRAERDVAVRPDEHRALRFDSVTCAEISGRVFQRGGSDEVRRDGHAEFAGGPGCGRDPLGRRRGRRAQ